MGRSAFPAPEAAVALTNAQARDLDLVMAGVLPADHVLGGPVTATVAGGRVTGTTVALPATALPAVARSSVDPSPPLVLLDQESTPMARMPSPSVSMHEETAVVAGEVEPLRARESGALGPTTLRPPDTTQGQGQDGVLVLFRGPTDDDDDVLQRWARDAPAAPMVLVAEGGSRPWHLPPRVGHAIAEDLLHRLGRDDARVMVVPAHLRDPSSDHQLATLLADRFGGPVALALSEHAPGAGAGTWARAVAALARGGDGALAGVQPSTEQHLRRWRPPRLERGLVVLFTGLSGSGKSTLARDLDTRLQLHSDRSTTLLDGDVVRRLLSSGLGFDRASREANVRRIGWVAARVAEHGGTAICSPIAPFAATRQEVRNMVEAVADLVLVHVSTPLEECERRDLKGLYARARSGEIPDFTGISSPYEPPVDADVVVDTSAVDRRQGLQTVVDHLVDGGWLPEAAR